MRPGSVELDTLGSLSYSHLVSAKNKRWNFCNPATLLVSYSSWVSIRQSDSRTALDLFCAATSDRSGQTAKTDRPLTPHNRRSLRFASLPTP